MSRGGAAAAHVNERRSATLAPGAENGAGVTAGGPENPGNAVTLAIFAGAGWRSSLEPGRPLGGRLGGYCDCPFPKFLRFIKNLETLTF